MKLLSLSLAVFAVGVVAEPAIVRDYSSPERFDSHATSTASPSSNEATTTAPSIAATTTPSSNDIAYEQWQQLPDRLKQFIFDSNPKERIQERQNAAQGGGQAAAPLSPTQLSPTTIYNIGQGEMTYTQTFAPTPSQFPNPGSGTIGMGTIQGQVGKTKTYNNPAPSASVDHRVMLAVAGGIGAGIVL